MKYFSSSFFAISLAIPGSAFSLSATEIAQRMIDRDDGKTSYSRVTLLTCRFDPGSKKKKCQSSPRKKVFESISKDVGKKGKDSVGLSLLIEPAGEKGVAFLQHDYDSDAKDSEQWIFLPAMKRLKRVVSEGNNSPKTGSFFGSVISYEDIEKTHLSDYRYELKGEKKVGDRPAWLLESKPTTKRAPKTSYGRSKLWIDQETFILLKSENYSRSGELRKTLRNLKIEKRQGVWLARQTVVLDHKASRMSLLRTVKTVLNIDIPQGLLGVRALNDPNFRESKLNPIRSKAK